MTNARSTSTLVHVRIGRITMRHMIGSLVYLMRFGREKRRSRHSTAADEGLDAAGTVPPHCTRVHSHLLPESRRPLYWIHQRSRTCNTDVSSSHSGGSSYPFPRRRFALLDVALPGARRTHHAPARRQPEPDARRELHQLRSSLAARAAGPGQAPQSPMERQSLRPGPHPHLRHRAQVLGHLLHHSRPRKRPPCARADLHRAVAPAELALP